MNTLAPDYETARRQLRIQGYALLGPFEDAHTSRAFIEGAWPLLPQYDGEYVYHVRARPEYDNLPLSQGRLAIGPHTEGIAYETPPRYLALHCLHQATCGGGHTNLYDGHRVLGELAPSELEFCKTELFEFLTSGSFGTEKLNCSRKPIVQFSSEGELQISFSDNFFRWGDLNPTDLAAGPDQGSDRPEARVVKTFLSACDRAEIKILIPENVTLVWDNYRMLHSRDRYTDPGRHIVRYWMGQTQ